MKLTLAYCPVADRWYLTFCGRFLQRRSRRLAGRGVGATGCQITGNWDDVREYNRLSIWGHEPPAVFAQMQRLVHAAAAPVVPIAEVA